MSDEMGTHEGEGQDTNVILLPGLDGRNARLDAWKVADEDDGDEVDEVVEETDELGPPPPEQLEGAIEALLLASGDPLSLTDLDIYLSSPGQDAVHRCLLDLQDRLRRGKGGLRLVEVSKGWQLRTDVRFARWVAVMRGGKPVRLSRAALETLAMVAYRQPITRSEVETLRGVDSGGVVKHLCDRGLLAIVGRQDLPGRPLLYGTTRRFLEMFGLRDLSELPTLRDLRELRADDPSEGPVPVEDDEDDAASDDPVPVDSLFEPAGTEGDNPLTFAPISARPDRQQALLTPFPPRQRPGGDGPTGPVRVQEPLPFQVDAPSSAPADVTADVSEEDPSEE